MNSEGSNAFFESIAKRIEVHHQAKLDWYEAKDMGIRCMGCKTPLDDNTRKRNCICVTKKGQCSNVLLCNRSWCNPKLQPRCSFCCRISCVECTNVCPECTNVVCDGCLCKTPQCWYDPCPNNREMCRDHWKLTDINKNGIAVWQSCVHCKDIVLNEHAYMFDCHLCALEMASASECEHCKVWYCPHKKHECNQKKQKIH